MTDQPTPTSSLEEARRRVERAWYLYDGCVDRDEVEAAVKAFARAEVIREVEAARAAALELYEGFDWVGTGTSAGAEREREEFLSRYPWLRALSQGGEGKSDG